MISTFSARVTRKKLTIAITLVIFVYILNDIKLLPCSIPTPSIAGSYCNENTVHTKLLVTSLNDISACADYDNMYNRDDTIYWHEPMSTWERLERKWHRGENLKVFKEDPLQNFELAKSYVKSYYLSSYEFYEEVFNCNFSLKIENFIRNAVVRCPEYILKSKTLSRLFQCRTDSSNKITCILPRDITSSLNQLCRQKKFIIVKDRVEKMPLLEKLFKHLSPTILKTLNILQLAQDPRAIVYELSKFGLIPRNINEADFQDITQHLCDSALYNIMYGQYTLHNVRYTFRYYEQLNRKSFGTLLTNILNNRTLGASDVDARKILPECNDWRQEIPFELSFTIENVCYRFYSSYAYQRFSFSESRLRGSENLLEIN